MSTDGRTRFLAGIIIAVIVPVGLLARSYRAGADWTTLFGFLATYLGDALWPVLFYFVGRMLLPQASTRALVTFTLGITLTLEFSQLWKPPILQWLRAQPVIGFVLGNRFIWSDVACCIVGTVIALLIDLLFIKGRQLAVSVDNSK